MDGMTDLGLRIRRAREAKRLHGQPWTQEYLASKLGVSTRTVGRWESGAAVPRGSIGAIEELLNVSLGEDADPVEEELRELLGRLQDMNILSEAEARAKLDGYRERRHRARNGSITSRAS